MIQNYIITAFNKKHFIEMVERLDVSATRYKADIRPYKKKRSNEQNERLWQFFTDFAAYIGYEGKDEIEKLKEAVTMEVAPVIVTSPTGKEYAVPPRTSKMTVAELTQLMDACERYGQKLGFYWGENE